MAALTVAGSPALGVACGASAGFNVTRAGSGSGVAAVVVRGDAFRDCGHGVRCAAAGALPSLAAASSQMAQVVAPLEGAGYRVDVYVSTYRCDGVDAFDGWLRTYEPAAVAAPPAERAARETQRDTLLRGLALVRGPVDVLVLVRADLLFVAGAFPDAVLAAREAVLFHADMSGGRHGAPTPFSRGSGAVTDKLHVLRK